MRKGLDLALAAALKTDAQTLFSDYRATSPEQAPLNSTNDESTDAEPLRRKLNAIVELLPPERLNEAYGAIRPLLAEAMAVA
jgi:hypothetical protein